MLIKRPHRMKRLQSGAVEAFLRKKQFTIHVEDIPPGVALRGTAFLNNQVRQVQGFKLQYVNVSPTAALANQYGNTGSLIYFVSNVLSGYCDRDQTPYTIAQSYNVSGLTDLQGASTPGPIGILDVLNYTANTPTIFNTVTKATDNDLNAFFPFLEPVDLQQFDWALQDVMGRPISGANPTAGQNCCCEIVFTLYTS